MLAAGWPTVFNQTKVSWSDKAWRMCLVTAAARHHLEVEGGQGGVRPPIHSNTTLVLLNNILNFHIHGLFISNK